MKVNYIFKLTTLENNERYSHIVEKVDKLSRDVRPLVNVKCEVEFLNQTQIRQKIGNKLDFLYAIKMLHYNNVVLVFNEFYHNMSTCKLVTNFEDLKSEVLKYDKDRTKVANPPTEG